MMPQTVRSSVRGRQLHQENPVWVKRRSGRTRVVENVFMGRAVCVSENGLLDRVVWVWHLTPHKLTVPYSQKPQNQPIRQKKQTSVANPRLRRVNH